MDSYDETSDPEEHIENIKVVLTYRFVRGANKCKLFVTTLARSDDLVQKPAKKFHRFLG